jgi:hypothetical protein
MRVHLLCTIHYIWWLGGGGGGDRVKERVRGRREKSDLENQLLLKWRSIVKSRKTTDGKKVVRIRLCTAVLRALYVLLLFTFIIILSS